MQFRFHFTPYSQLLQLGGHQYGCTVELFLMLPWQVCKALVPGLPLLSIQDDAFLLQTKLLPVACRVVSPPQPSDSYRIQQKLIVGLFSARLQSAYQSNPPMN